MHGVLVGLALVPVTAGVVWADHGAGRGGNAPGGAASSAVALILLAGVLLVVALAAWAMFAPEREERGEDER